MFECINQDQAKPICEKGYGLEQISLVNLLETISDAVYICSDEFKIIYMNTAMADLIGVDKIGTVCHKAIYNSDEKCSWCVFDRVMKGKPVQYELFNQTNKHYYWASNSCIFDKEGSSLKLTIFHDITRARQMEQETLIERNLQSLGLLAGGIAHDFNNLLAGLLGSLELMQMEINSEVKRSKYLKTIKKAFIRTRELTNRLILFSEGAIPVKKTFSINALLNDSIGSFLNDSDIKVKFSIPDNIWFVNIDKDQIKLVIDNIFINAVEAVNKKGQVQVNCKNIEKLEENILFLNKGKYVRIDIKDDGCGISEENINKIFDPYFSTKEWSTNKGQGLGLAVCHSIIKKHNGAIFVISDLEKGTTVSIYLPGLENNA